MTFKMNGLILLVDDNLVQREARREILSRAGAQVVAARSGEQALEMLSDPATLSALRLLVTDHLMPGMHGPALVAHVSRMLPELPILVLSGLPDAEEEYAGTPVFFRLKPCPPNELIRLAKHLVGNQALRSA